MNAIAMIRRCARYGEAGNYGEYVMETIVASEAPSLPEEAMGHGDNSIDQQVST